MKNSTKNPVSVTLLVLLLLTVHSCKPGPGSNNRSLEPAQAYPGFKTQPCQAQNIPNEYILYFEDPADKRISRVISILKDRLNDVPVDSCLCGVYLMRNQTDPIESITRREEALDDPDLSGKNGILMDLNYPLQTGPLVYSGTLSTPAKAIQDDSHYQEFKSSVSIAILDSGFDPAAPGLQDETARPLQQYVWKNREEGNANAVQNADDDGNCVADDVFGYDAWKNEKLEHVYDGHGTAVAGVIARVLDRCSSEPVHAQFMNIKITHPNADKQESATLFDAICGLRYAMDQEAGIIQASWGFYREKPGKILTTIMDTLDKWQVSLVAAVGNDGINIDSCPFWPASFAKDHPGVLAVGALNAEESALASFSNYSTETPVFAAPGEQIRVLQPRGSTVSILDGTSLAAPFVTGMVARHKAQNGDLDARPLRNCLKELDDVTIDRNKGVSAILNAQSCELLRQKKVPCRNP